ncbi:hypothetical protein POF50_008660 [Streptomyces sp. SL13]|uniref:Uncharacterized protein n=1 Tax=Streptantibioticus silvisoli TaxID=2705255 RepID=A0AA90H1R8_9ACTN|nr:hypothetical protein [Streptantibioticus silvisoli]MDI5969413.1 hypothetical protein [Streptantibioticus silvisoli]
MTVTLPPAAAILPSCDDPETISGVTAAVDDALAGSPYGVIIAADASPTPATRAVFENTPTRARKVALTCRQAGRDSQILEALPLAPHLAPVLIIDTTTTTPEPELYRALVRAVEHGGTAVADHPHPHDEDLVTDLLVRPLIAGATGLDVPTPLSGDLALAPTDAAVVPTVVGRQDSELADAVKGFGIDPVLLLQTATGERLLEAGATASVGSVADSYDCQAFRTGSRKDRVAPAEVV